MATVIADEGCPVDAAQADFFITALGELCRGDEELNHQSALDLQALARERGFDWQEVRRYTRRDDGQAARRWWDAVADEFDRRLSEELTEREYAFTKKACAFQEAVDQSRFRVYGELRAGRAKMVLVSEFLGLVEDDALWQEIMASARQTKAHIWVMSEGEHIDYRILSHGQPREQQVYGPDHGKRDRQIEFSWRIEELSVADLEALVERLRRDTQVIWQKAGVGVC